MMHCGDEEHSDWIDWAIAAVVLAAFAAAGYGVCRLIAWLDVFVRGVPAEVQAFVVVLQFVICLAVPFTRRKR